ncbi:MAG: hypothetical protein R6U00_04700 [Prochlorococcaceae cyanobacterium]
MSNLPLDTLHRGQAWVPAMVIREVANVTLMAEKTTAGQVGVAVLGG